MVNKGIKPTPSTRCPVCGSDERIEIRMADGDKESAVGGICKGCVIAALAPTRIPKLILP